MAASDEAERFFRAGLDSLEMLRSADHASEYRSDLESAVESFGHAIAADPRHLGALRARARALFDLGRYSEAAADYESAVRVAPADAELRVRLGRSLARLNRHSEALNAFEQALQLR